MYVVCMYVWRPT